MQRNPEVDAWFDAYDNPQKPLVQAVREVILATDDRVTEAIKWKAPTFVHDGNIASFYAARTDALRGLVAAWIDLKS